MTWQLQGNNIVCYVLGHCLAWDKYKGYICPDQENCGNYLLMSQAWSLLEIASQHKACGSSCAKGWEAEIVLRLAIINLKIG